MGAPDSPVVAEDIAIDGFSKLLGEYPRLIGSIATPKSGQQSLAELDQFRYEAAVELFGTASPKREMNIEDVKLLVEWKLRHGKFRPTLMSLVSSNPPDLIRTTVSDAISSYREDGNVDVALKTLCKLRGIGPATASLLLSVHDPEKVIFFSDEAYYWLCGGGKKVSLKYNPKEYAELRGQANELRDRLGVSSMDIEKVAYVVLRSPLGEAAAAEQPSNRKTDAKILEGRKNNSSHNSKQATSKQEAPGAKRKAEGVRAAADDDGPHSVRRSRRLRG